MTLQISVSYRWRDTETDDCPWQFKSDQINYRMSPPLYGKVTAHEEELRLKQQLQHHQQQQQQVAPPPGHHFIPHGPQLHHYAPMAH